MTELKRGALSATDGAPYTPSEEAIAYSKVTWRLIPFLFICYIVAYLDRTSISFAQIQMQSDLGFSDAVYGLGAGIFFIGYSLFEVPSNLLMQKIGARKTLIRIMVLWGAVATGMMFVTTPMQFYVMRFLLGVFEAGFFPGVIYFLTKWYTGTRRGAVLSMFMLGMPISGVLGGPIAGWALNSLDGFQGLEGWQWLFIVEGLPAIFLGLMVFWIMDDDPSQAKWLTERERALIIHNVKVDQANNPPDHGHSIFMALKDKRVYILCLAYFTFISGIYAIGFWVPAMLKAAGVTDVFEIGLYSMIPFGISAIGMVLISRSSDKHLERRWHAAICAVVGAAALSLIPAFRSDLTSSLVVISIATTAIYTLLPLFWSITSAYFTGTVAAAASIAFINSVGLTGGLASPSIIGWVKTTTGSLSNGLFAISAMLVIGAIVLLIGIKASDIRERKAAN